MSETTTNPLIYSDQDIENLETRLRVRPDLPVDTAVTQRLLDTAKRARQALASLSVGPVNRSLARTRALINFGLGESEAAHE